MSIYGTQRRVLEAGLTGGAGAGTGTCIVGKKSCKDDSEMAK